MVKRASPQLIEVAVGRRRQLTLRLVVGLMAALGMAPVVGAGVAATWLTVWYLLQGAEYLAAGTAARRDAHGRPWPAIVPLALMFLTNLVFAAMAVIAVRTGEAWVILASAWIVWGALLNAAATSLACRAAFFASATPAAVLCASLPLWIAGASPTWPSVGAVAMGTILLLTATQIFRNVGLKAIAEAREANAAKTIFLANISHEIRTPLNGVIGMTQLMASETSDAEQRERLEVIRRSGQALLSLLNDVLDLSKVEAGKMELENGEIDVV